MPFAMRHATAAATLCLALGLAPAAGAATFFAGADNGAPTAGPFPNSAAARSSFLGAAGPTSLITFETTPLGFDTRFRPAPGVTVTMQANDFGSRFSGVTDNVEADDQSLYGFNVTPGGSRWFGFTGGAATFSFAMPITAFGLYLTGTQSDLSLATSFIFDNGTGQEATSTSNDRQGGATYFGIVSPTPFSRITISNTSFDAWGVDDVSYSTQLIPAPEPGTLALLAAGLLGLGFARRRAT